MLRLPSSSIHAIVTIPVGLLAAYLLASPAVSAFPIYPQGRHPHSHFRDLSTFIHITACMFAESLSGSFYASGFSCFVTSTSALAASGRSIYRMDFASTG